MSGLFQRIARRRADDEPDEAAAPTTDLAAGNGTDGAPAADGDVQTAQTATSSPAPASEIDVTSARDPQPDATTQQQIGTVELPAMELATSVQPTVPASPSEAAAPADGGAATPPPGDTTPASTVEGEQPAAAQERRPGFRERGKMRRRVRYLRKVRELQVRDLGGLVFDLRRFERKRDDLVAQKIDQIRASDDELRALERALDERRELRDVHEPGIGGTCPRCFALFGSADRFCSHCGAALGGAVQGPAQVPTLPAPAQQPPIPGGGAGTPG